MLTLPILDESHLTSKELEKYLNSCCKYLNDQKNTLLAFEYDDLSKKIISEVHYNIIKSKKVELVVKNVEKSEWRQTNFWSEYIENSTNINKIEDEGEWDQYSVNLMDIYIISFKLDYNTKFDEYEDEILPQYEFIEILGDKPENIRKGQKRILNLNFFKEEHYSVDFSNNLITYFDKKNLKPQPKSNAKSNCFVVTTTMGDINHPVVVDFRNYRDNVLMNYYFGRFFIYIYYRIGPFLSKVIKANSFLFSISKKIIIKLHSKIK